MVFDYWLAGIVTAGLLALRDTETLRKVRSAPDREALFRLIADAA